MRLIDTDTAAEIVRFECGKWERLANAIIKEFYALKPLDAVQVVRCAVCTHFQCNMCGDGTLPKGVEEFECRNGRGGCDPMGFCDEGEPKDDDGK